MAKPPKNPDDLRPPFSDEDRRRIREILEEAQIDPDDFFKLPDKQDPDQGQGHKVNPKIPEGRMKERWNGQKGNGTFTPDHERWQPGCEQPFVIHMSETWLPPPAGLAGKFRLWAAFATVRAILICRRNDKCRRVQPLGCDHSFEHKYANGEVNAGAGFVFQCVEI